MNLIRPSSNSFTLVKPEPTPVPGRTILTTPLLQLWAALALTALGLGLLWRLTGMAPDLATTLDGWGLVLWLTALATAPLWDSLLRRRSRHGRHGLRFGFRHIGDAGQLWLAGLALSLAAAGLLIAYNPRIALPGVKAFTMDLPLPGWGWFIGVLIIAGPALALASTALLHFARRFCGPVWGTLIWLLTGLLLHRNLITGEAGLPTGISWPPQLPPPAGLNPDALLLPVSLGDFARWWGLNAAQTNSDTVFLGEFLLNLIRDPGILTVAALVLLVILTRPLNRSAGQLPVGWLAACTAIGAVTMRSGLQCWLWVSDTARIFPGSWQGQFCLGTGIIWTLWLAIELFRNGRTPWLDWRDILWSWFALAAVTALALPGIEAGQATHSELLLAAAAALPLLTLGLLLINFVGRSGGPANSAGRSGALMLLAFLLVLPLPGMQTVASPALIGWRLLAAALAAPGPNYLAWGALATAVACCIALWPRRGSRKAKPATGSAGTT